MHVCVYVYMYIYIYMYMYVRVFVAPSRASRSPRQLGLPPGDQAPRRWLLLGELLLRGGPPPREPNLWLN